MDWQTQTASALGRAISEGRADPVELTESFLDAIKEHPSRDRIFARLTEERALGEAMAARKRARTDLRLSPLDGVPISWKDLFDTAGTPTEAGSKLLAGRVPARDAVVLRNATLAGMVCLGKTHMTELAFSGLGVNPSTATPPNAIHPDLAPGGSSSGAAASVAFGLAAAGIGSDTGGSVRLPSAWNDLVGFKPTHGTLSLGGVVPLAEQFDTVGPLCRSVEDCALLFAIMGQTKPPSLKGVTLDGMRLGVLEPYASEVREEPGAAFQSSIDRLTRSGASVSSQRSDAAIEAMETCLPLYTAEAYGTWSATIEADPDKMYHLIRDRFRQGASVKAADYVALWRRLRELRTSFYADCARFDALLIPTAANLPPDLKRLGEDPEYFVTENLLTLRNTRVGNLMGLCAISLPTGTKGAGLMIMAGPGEDAKLLRIAAAASAALNL